MCAGCKILVKCLRIFQNKMIQYIAEISTDVNMLTS